jgi:hypothetical protein
LTTEGEPARQGADAATSIYCRSTQAAGRRIFNRVKVSVQRIDGTERKQQGNRQREQCVANKPPLARTTGHNVSDHIGKRTSCEGQSRLANVADRSHSIQALQPRIDGQSCAVQLSGDFVGGLSGAQHIAELIFFPGRPRSRRRFQRAHFPFALCRVGCRLRFSAQRRPLAWWWRRKCWFWHPGYHRYLLHDFAGGIESLCKGRFKVIDVIKNSRSKPRPVGENPRMSGCPRSI